MAVNILDILTIGSKILDRVLPDPAQKAAATLEMFRAQQAGEFKELDNELQRDLAQIEVNKAEAESPDFFRGGWRPAVGWCGVVGLLYTYLVQPLLSWWSSAHAIPVPPQLDLGDLLTLLGGLLGLSGMRTLEKIKGVASR